MNKARARATLIQRSVKEKNDFFFYKGQLSNTSLIFQIKLRYNFLAYKFNFMRNLLILFVNMLDPTTWEFGYLLSFRAHFPLPFSFILDLEE